MCLGSIYNKCTQVHPEARTVRHIMNLSKLHSVVLVGIGIGLGATTSMFLHSTSNTVNGTSFQSQHLPSNHYKDRFSPPNVYNWGIQPHIEHRLPRGCHRKGTRRYKPSIQQSTQRRSTIERCLTKYRYHSRRKTPSIALIPTQTL